MRRTRLGLVPLLASALIAACRASVLASDLHLPSLWNESLAWSRSITQDTCEARGSGSHAHATGSIRAVVSASDARHNSVSFINKQCYAARHHIEHFHLQHSFLGGSNLSGHWNKVFALKAALRAVPPGDWVLWMDTDALILNLERSPDVVLRGLLESTCGGPMMCGKARGAGEGSKGSEGDTVCRREHRPADCQVLAQSGLNNGLLVFRNTCWTMRFLDAWLAFRRACTDSPTLFDQSGFMIAVREALRGRIGANTVFPEQTHECGIVFDAEWQGTCTKGELPSQIPARSAMCVVNAAAADRRGHLNVSPLYGAGKTETSEERKSWFWQTGDFSAHFPGSSRSFLMFRSAADMCFHAFMNATLPVHPHDVDSLTFRRERCEAVVSLATVAAPDCTHYNFGGMTNGNALSSAKGVGSNAGWSRVKQHDPRAFAPLLRSSVKAGDVAVRTTSD